MASYVKSAADGVESGANTVAESVRGTLGHTVADAVKAGGEYGKAGITKTGEALGFKEVSSELFTVISPLEQAGSQNFHCLEQFPRYLSVEVVAPAASHLHSSMLRQRSGPVSLGVTLPTLNAKYKSL